MIPDAEIRLTARRDPIPRQLRAILRIANSSPELLLKFSPYISIEQQNVLWEQIFNQDFTDENFAGVHWAYAIWTGDTLTRNISIYNLNSRLACAVLEALMIAWGLDDNAR